MNVRFFLMELIRIREIRGALRQLLKNGDG